jgi:PPOX class probable F420-dependent enzyme
MMSRNKSWRQHGRRPGRQLEEIEQFDRDDVPVTIAEHPPRHPVDLLAQPLQLATQPDEHDQRRPDPDQPEHHQHDRDRFHDATLWQRYLWIVSLAMTPIEREAFLAEVHVAVVTVADDDGRGPLAIPLWYDYQPGGEIILVTDGDSRKAQLIRRAGRATVCAQTQEMPYRYASVEGPVTAIEDTVTVEQRWELARRYLGHEGADGYIEATRDVTDRMCAIHIRPEHWLTRDYTKAGE